MHKANFFHKPIIFLNRFIMQCFIIQLQNVCIYKPISIFYKLFHHVTAPHVFVGCNRTVERNVVLTPQLLSCQPVRPILRVILFTIVSSGLLSGSELASDAVGAASILWRKNAPWSVASTELRSPAPDNDFCRVVYLKVMAVAVVGHTWNEVPRCGSAKTCIASWR
jgi:hypothetical protein